MKCKHCRKSIPLVWKTRVCNECERKLRIIENEYKQAKKTLAVARKQAIRESFGKRPYQYKHRTRVLNEEQKLLSNTLYKRFTEAKELSDRLRKHVTEQLKKDGFWV